MSANPDNLKRTRTAQFSELENRLKSLVDDESVLAEIHVAIKGLMSNDRDSEAHIRQILQNRVESGSLPPESVKLVQKMLDWILTESHSTIAIASDFPVKDDTPSIDTAAVTGKAPAEKTPDRQVQSGSVIKGRFLLKQQILDGSMGVVFAALDQRLAEAGDADPNIAITVLSPRLSRNAEAMRALQQEVVKGRCLVHRNIVRYIDLEREGNLYFIVMERLEGKLLESILYSSGNQNFDLADALNIVTQLSQALEFAHQRGVVHADVKPGNIMITATGDVELFDFGVARVLQKEQEAVPDNDPDAAGAKAPQYSSMQVLTGEEPVPADDVFSLACLLYRLVAGYRVFGPRNAAAAAAAGMEPQEPDGLSETQWQAVKKALAYSRVPRYASPAAFAAALDGMAETRVAPPVTELIVPVEDRRDMRRGSSRRSPWRFAVPVIILIVSAAVGLQTGMLGKLGQLLPSSEINTTSRLPEQSNTASETGPEMAQSVTQEEAVANTLEEEFVGEAPAEGSAGDPVDAGTRIEPEIDFAALLPPTMTVGLAAAGKFTSEVELTLREDSDAATIDLVRMHKILESYSVLLEEVDFNGNQSARESGQYQIANDGLLEFAAGQSRARTTISMRSDSQREPDRQVTIRIREADNAASELARIKLSLEDDDQRAFESGLPKNTIAFTVSQMSVREADAAVQIDVTRFQADHTAVEASYVVRDVTATAGEDYFPPGPTIVNFGRGQRSARIFIPLVQDAAAEGDETFTIELVNTAPQADPDIYQRITVIIRDDD